MLRFLIFHLDGVLDDFVPPENKLSLLPSLGNVSGHISEKGGEVKERIKNRWHSYMSGTRRIKKKEGFKNFKLEVAFF